MRSPRSIPGRTRCSTWRRRSPEFSTASGSAAARFLNALFRPKIDRILFAATKADHLHHSSHDRLEAVLRRAVARAVMRAEDTGATIDVVALAAVRATREAQVTRDRESLPSILGTPIVGRKRGRRNLRRQHRSRDLSRRTAGGPASPVRERDRVFRPRQRARRRHRLPLPALPPAPSCAGGRECRGAASHPP